MNILSVYRKVSDFEGFMLNIDIKRSQIQGGPDIQVFNLNVDTNRSQT